MKHVLAAWEEIEPLVKDCYLMLFLDYDGTLTPIVEHPGLAQLSPRAKKILEDLRFNRDVKVILMSGRLLEDLKELVGVRGIIYAGNHGLELEGPFIRHVHPEALDTCELLQEIFQQLTERLRPFPGVFVEDKILTLSIHYRNVPEEKVETAKKIFLEILQPWERSSRIIITEGKKVWEVRPGIPWDKGTAVLWLYDQILADLAHKAFPIYIGDDRTDEDAFLAVKGKGIGVKVLGDENSASEAAPADRQGRSGQAAGGSLSEAAYYVHSPEEVLDFLERLTAVKRKNKEPPKRWTRYQLS